MTNRPDKLNLTQNMARVLALIDKAIEGAGAKLDASPDNPHIGRIEGFGGRAFSLSSSEVFKADNWTPFFHDWKRQYEFAKELLQKRQFSKLKLLLDNNCVDDRRFAPQVIANIKRITGDLQFEPQAYSALA